MMGRWQRVLPVGLALLVALVVWLGSRSGRDVVVEEGRGEVVRLPVREKGLLSGRETVATRAVPFPHNLETFDDWGAISAEEMAAFKTSLISRVGYLDAGGVGEFYFRVREGIEDPVALVDFREAVLGVWCAKDVEDCLNSLRENLGEGEAFPAMQDALAGWAAEDWMTGLRFLQKHGDVAVEARVGGDSSRFVKNLISEVARANGLDEARGALSYLRSANNVAAAVEILEDLEQREE